MNENGGGIRCLRLVLITSTATSSGCKEGTCYLLFIVGRADQRPADGLQTDRIHDDGTVDDNKNTESCSIKEGASESKLGSVSTQARGVSSERETESDNRKKKSTRRLAQTKRYSLSLLPRQ
jgi:hypothetical protein